MPPRIPHAAPARAPIDRPAQELIAASPPAAPRRIRRMSDVLEGDTRRQRRRVSTEVNRPNPGPAVAPRQVEVQLEQMLGQLMSRPARQNDLAEVSHMCRTFGTARVLQQLLTPERARLAMLMLPALIPGRYGEIIVAQGPSGEKHLGRYQNGEAIGYGVFLRADGCLLSGLFLHGDIDGAVVMRRPDGAELKGNIHAGKWQGIVTERSPDGAWRYGPMVDGQSEGKVSEYDAQGNATYGRMHKGLFEGPLTRFYSDGSHANCVMLHGRMHGPYERFFAGGRLVGTMVHGLLEGQAEQIGPGEQYIRGDVVAGRFTGCIERRFAAGEIYYGQAVDGQPHGHGVKILQPGFRYEGRFIAGQFCGHGTMTLPNGDKASGVWRDGTRHGNYTYLTASGINMLYQVSAVSSLVFEQRPASAKPIRFDGRSSSRGTALLQRGDWRAMLAHHDAQAKKTIGANRKTDLFDPWRDWSPNTPNIEAIAGMFDNVASAQADTHPGTHQFLMGLMHMLGPAQPYSLFVGGAFRVDFNLFGHFPNQAAFIAATMPLDSASVLEFVLKKDENLDSSVSVLFHQENYFNARAMFVSSFDYMVAGLTQAWQHDAKKGDKNYAASNAVLTHLLDNGPCMEARTTAMTQTLLGLELVDNVARTIPDLEGKDLFAQSNEMLRLFRDQAIERFAQVYDLDPHDSLAIEGDARFVKNFFNSTFFRRFMASFATFKDVPESEMEAVIRYQVDVIGVLEAFA